MTAIFVALALAWMDDDELRAAVGRPLGAARAVEFRALWDRSGDHRGEVVAVEGRAARRFRQPAGGGWPGLTELWLRTTGDNVIGLVYPTPSGEDVKLGTRVRFAGTALGLVDYAGGDVGRRAPLIAGPEPPVPARSTDAGLGGWWRGIVAGGFAAMIGVGLAWVQMRRPGRLLTSRGLIDGVGSS